LQKEAFFFDKDQWAHASVPPESFDGRLRQKRRVTVRGSMPASELWAQARLYVLECSLLGTKAPRPKNPVVELLARVIAASSERKRNAEKVTVAEGPSELRRKAASARRTLRNLLPSQAIDELPRSVYRSFLWRGVVRVLHGRTLFFVVPWAPSNEIPPRPRQGAWVAIWVSVGWHKVHLGSYDAERHAWRLGRNQTWEPIST
jgi:hypothetical protein